jgi:hypothetical protein
MRSLRPDDDRSCYFLHHCFGHRVQSRYRGKVGGLALAYFLVMSTFALAIGLIVGNLIQPGEV